MDSMLGGLTDELEGEGFISELIALAPKTYAYKLNNGDVKIKAKGFYFNADAQGKITFENMKKMVMTLKDTESIDETNERTKQEVEYGNIRINHKTKRLENKTETKSFKLNFTKRRILFDKATKHRIPTAPLHL